MIQQKTWAGKKANAKLHEAYRDSRDIFPEYLAKISCNRLRAKLKKEKEINEKRLNALEIKANEFISNRVSFIREALKTTAYRGEFSLNITSFITNIPEDLKEKSEFIFDKISSHFTKKGYLLIKVNNKLSYDPDEEVWVSKHREYNIIHTNYYLSWEHFKPEQKPVEELNSYRGYNASFNY